MNAIVLAGGKGTRLKPLTDKIPKPLIKVGKKPCLDYVVANLKKHGINDIMLSLWHKPKDLAEYAVDNGLMFYVQDKDLGTAGAIKLLDWWLTDPFMIVNGDTITNVDITEMLTIYRNNRDSRASVFTNHDLKHNGGTFIFSKEVLDQIPDDKPFSIQDDLLPKIFHVDIYDKGWYFDIGTVEKLKFAIEALK